MVATYAVYISALSIRQQDAFLTTKADLGHFDQTIWNTLHGRLLVRTQLGRQLTRLTDHVEPILVPVSLVFLVWDDVRALLVLQAVAVALGALPAYWLTRDEVARRGAGAGGQVQGGTGGLASPAPEIAGLAVALVYLLFPALVAANLTEFHAAPLVVAPMLLALYYARQGRYGRMWLWALVVMAVKEEMPLLTLMLGLWLVVFRRQWRHGLALAAVSLAWFGVATFWIVPHFAPLKYGVEESVYFQRYRELGDSPWAVARTLVTQPGRVWAIATEPARLRYLAGMLAPAGLLLPLLAPEVLLLSLPSLLANLLSGYEAMYSGIFHYSAPIVPFVVAASAVGLGRLARLAGGGRRGKAVVMAAAALLAMATLATHRFHGHTHLTRGFHWPVVTAHHRLLEQRFAPQIPPEAVLSTTAPLFPHLDHRERIHQFPRVDDATWVLLDAGSFPEMHPADFRAAYDELMASGAWCIVDAADGYILLERREGVDAACGRELPDTFYDFARISDPQPETWVGADWGDSVRLLGYDVTSVPQWHRVGVRLYWQALRDGESDLKLFPFWLGETDQVVETADQRPLVEPVWYPPSRWRAGEVVVTEMLPWDIGPAFRLGVSVLDPEGGRVPVRLLASGESQAAARRDLPAYALEGGSWLRLGAYAWQEGQVRLVDEGAEPAQALDATFGGLFVLSGLDLEPQRARPGDDLRLGLHWHALATAEREVTVFVHLLAGGGQRVAQADAVPGFLGVLPTTLWRPGVPVLDQHVLSLPRDLPPGDYVLRVGWYDPQDGERLLLDDGADSLWLAQVRVR